MALDLTKQHFAYDLSNKIISKGEVFDYDAINNSIAAILMTSRGERLFLPTFGSDLPLIIFENFTNGMSESLVESIIDSIEKWEDRIKVDRENVSFIFREGQNVLEIYIPYIILRYQIKTFFARKIVI